MEDDGFERLLRGLLGSVSRTSFITLVGLAIYGFGYAAIFRVMPTTGEQIGYFACLALWGTSTGAYRLIFGKTAR